MKRALINLTSCSSQLGYYFLKHINGFSLKSKTDPQLCRNPCKPLNWYYMNQICRYYSFLKLPLRFSQMYKKEPIWSSTKIIINYQRTYSPEIPQQLRLQVCRSSVIIYPWRLFSNILCHSECVMWLQADLSCRQLKLGLSICCGGKKRQTLL